MQKRSDNNNQPAPPPKSGQKVFRTDVAKITVGIEDLQKLRFKLPAVLAKEGYRLVVVFSPDGQSRMGLVNENKRSIPNLMPIDDLNKLVQARRVLSGADALQKKETKGIEAKISILRAKANTSKPITVPTDYVERHALLQQKMNFLAVNKEQLQNNVNSDKESKLAQAWLLDQANRIAAANEDHVVEILTASEKPDVKASYAKFGVVNWVASKLTSNKLDIGANSNVARILFPTKIDTTIKVSVKEMLDKEVRATVEALYSGTKSPYIEILKGLMTTKMLLAISGIEEAEETNPEWAGLLKSTVTLPTIIPSPKYCEKYVSSAYPSEGTFGRITGIVNSMNDFLGIAVPQGNINEYLRKISATKLFNGFTYNRNITVGLREQMKDFLKQRSAIGYFDILDWQTMLPIYYSPTTESSDVVAKLVNDFIKATTIIVTPPTPVKGDLTVFKKYSENDFNALELSNEPLLNAIKSAAPRNREINPVTTLQHNSKILVAKMDKSPRFRPLVDNVKNYLRAYVDPVIQNTAAGLMLATLEQLMDKPYEALPKYELENTVVLSNYLARKAKQSFSEGKDLPFAIERREVAEDEIDWSNQAPTSSLSEFTE